MLSKLAMTLIEPLAVTIGGVKKLGSLSGKRVLVFGKEATLPQSLVQDK